MENVNDERYYTIQEAADILKVSTKTVYGWGKREGLLVKVPNLYYLRIKGSELKYFSSPKIIKRHELMSSPIIKDKFYPFRKASMHVGVNESYLRGWSNINKFTTTEPGLSVKGIRGEDLLKFKIYDSIPDGYLDRLSFQEQNKLSKDEIYALYDAGYLYKIRVRSSNKRGVNHYYKWLEGMNYIPVDDVVEKEEEEETEE